MHELPIPEPSLGSIARSLAFPALLGAFGLIAADAIFTVLLGGGLDGVAR